MSYYSEEEKLYRLAQKRVKKKKGFYSHLKVFVIVNVFIMAITFFEGDVFPIPLPLSWGVGLAFHYFGVFGLPGGQLTDEWEDKEVVKEVNRLKERERRRQEYLEEEESLDLKEYKKVKNYREDDFV